jgi:nucleoside phosphorylase
MYTVGWICALPVEMAAATAMLDEVHQAPQELHPNDHNTYALGKIFNHNVVIACLPAANYGIAPAASTAQQMLTSFTGIRFGLLVGIGGGIPQEGHDIKLGDIVVSEPKGQLGGVVQYDRGKELGVCFERTGWLNSPPEVLLTGVSALKARQWMGKSQIQEHLSSLATNNPSFAHPLLKHDERNAMNTICEMSTQARSELSYRDMQDPAIHFGLIASGNQVIKDATTRDRLRQELGDVLCFEMEAAGLMNNFPCLVIRGISDYADYQKNDMWQPYASATAAAFAKELLSVAHAHEVEDNICIASVTSISSRYCTLVLATSLY